MNIHWTLNNCTDCSGRQLQRKLRGFKAEQLKSHTADYTVTHWVPFRVPRSPLGPLLGFGSLLGLLFMFWTLCLKFYFCSVAWLFVHICSLWTILKKLNFGTPFGQKRNNALCGSWKTGLKVVNFDKLFLRQFSTKFHQIWRDGVKTSKNQKDYWFPKYLKKWIF